MNLAILHYHLNPGGVTRVIANHLLSLKATAPLDERLRVMLLHDGQDAGWPDDVEAQLGTIEGTRQPIPSMGYWSETVTGSGRLLEELRTALAQAGFSPQETILHAHNHSLGKNAEYPVAIRELAKDGFAVLVQPHDFAEDFRPSNYRLLREALGTDELGGQVYPQGPHLHYATLNRRDFDILSRAGIGPERLHFLPNPVPEPASRPATADARATLQKQFGIDVTTEYVLYPVRGIRRKNIGEFALLSIMRNADLQRRRQDRSSVFAITLAPLNPTARPVYERWQTLAEELGLPCRFDVGGQAGMSFGEHLAAADRIVTTSVAEGFGMVFLESWLNDRPLAGRNLPEITADFVESGLTLNALYERLNVPLDWIGHDTFVDAIFAACQHVYADYGLSVPTRYDVGEVVERMTVDGTVDFGTLNEPLQERVIRRAVEGTSCCDTLLDLNPKLTRWDATDQATIAANQAVIREHYSLQASGKRLRVIYDALLGQGDGNSDSSLDVPADADRILRAFLDLDRFRLIRT